MSKEDFKVDPGKILTAEAHFTSMDVDGILLHIAKVKFPSGEVVVGTGDTPQLAIEDAFIKSSDGTKSVRYSAQAAFSMPQWLSDPDWRPHGEPSDPPARRDRLDLRRDDHSS